jgi:hypothetical protein
VTYLLDANVFIQAKNLHYGLDFCPAFWEWLVENNAAGRVLSIDKVADEIAAGGDELSDWMKHAGARLVRQTGTHVAAQFGRVSTWATGQQYEPAAINTFCRWPISTLSRMRWRMGTWSLRTKCRPIPLSVSRSQTPALVSASAS